MKSWVKMGNKYYFQEVGTNLEKLPPCIFRLDIDQFDNLYLTEVSDKFSFGGKLYDIEDAFVSRAIKSFKALGGNMGILLNGTKGTGKTVTAKIICNKLLIPTIIIHQDYKDIPAFINNFQQEAIFFFDEYEKIYEDYKSDILTVMDGVMTTMHKKLFILTTNESHVNYNMLQRPGRIRYFKTFEDLSREAILEIIDDTLENKDFKEDIIKFISELEIITIDIVKAVVSEVNIHNEPPAAFADIFNVKKIEDAFDVFEVLPGGKKECILKGVRVNFPKFAKLHVGRGFGEAGDDPIGYIKEVHGKNKATLTRAGEYGEPIEDDLFTIELQESSGLHGNFQGYVI